MVGRRTIKEIRNVHKILVGKPQKKFLGRPRSRQKDNSNIYRVDMVWVWKLVETTSECVPVTGF
jgi:hypothetical protein